MNIILGVTGSIAAYKAADLASQLVKRGHEVHVVMTREATEFITPLTLQVLSKNPVTVDLFDEKESWRPGHIKLADAADLLLVAPATAHLIAQFAHGLAPDALTAMYLASRARVLIAPAMNGKMWQHPATVNNTATLKLRVAAESALRSVAEDRWTWSPASPRRLAQGVFGPATRMWS